MKMRPYSDPTYLRTIHDGLLSGAVHKDNASALPLGLVGMYEEALPSASIVNDRKKFLEFFAVWALLKKEVSAGFVVPLLEGWFKKIDLHLEADGLFRKREEEVLEYIAQFSKWFNSPASGTYVLYHERLRAFALQKISDGQFKACNESIINQCRVSLQAKAGDEWERYALEHLSSHLLIQAMESKDATPLKALAYNTAHWNRQVEISKGFEWSKRMLNDMMLWASKYDDDEVIECALNKVDLHHLEQNDAPRIVELVAQNDIETALQRIEAFGGNDKEGLQRKFILYMLCLMELTLLDSKDKPFRKEAIEKLLKHLDESLPVDHSVLKWNDFFPSYLMFLMACEWAELGLDYLIVYKRTDDWEKDWIPEKGPYGDKQFVVLLQCSSAISDPIEKGSALNHTSTELARQGKAVEATVCATGIRDDGIKIRALQVISTELAKQGKVDQAASAMQEALAFSMGIYDVQWKCSMLKDISAELLIQHRVVESESIILEAFALAKSISDDESKRRVLKDISTELAKHGKIDEAASAMQEAMAASVSISSERARSSALMDISIELARQGKVDEALICAKGIVKDRARSSALLFISREFAKLGRTEDALDCARGTIEERFLAFDARDHTKALQYIAVELARQGKIEEALVLSRDINNDFTKSIALQSISSELTKQGMIDEGTFMMHEALTCAKGIIDDRDRSAALEIMSTELAKRGNIFEALGCAQIIGNDYYYWKNRALKKIANELAKQGKTIESRFALQNVLSSDRGKWVNYSKFGSLKDISTELAKMGKTKEASVAMKEVIMYARRMSDGLAKWSWLRYISIELAKQGKTDEALDCAKGVTNDRYKNGAFKAISGELAVQGKTSEALDCALKISDQREKSSALKDISCELAKQGKNEEALDCARGINSDYSKGIALQSISSELAKQDMIKEALDCARGISDDYSKSWALKDISGELTKQGRTDKARLVIQEALDCARGISNDIWKIIALIKISTELANQGKTDEASFAMQEALTFARGISSDTNRSSALFSISTELAKQRRTDDALECARGIIDERDKTNALQSISGELAKKGNWNLAETIGWNITQIVDRHSCWTTLAKNDCKENESRKALRQVNQFKTDEARLFYLKGWAETVNQQDADNACVQEALSQLVNDPESIEMLLQKHALYEVFFGYAGLKKINRLNRTLNIQWAIDIKNSFSAN
jgi:tetratricopeptide (TPR) repeat protein